MFPGRPYPQLLEHAHLAGPAILALTFGESLAFVGAVIPATPILLLIGSLLGSGALEPHDVIPWALTGAFMGYWASWAAGRRLGARLFRTRAALRRRRDLARVRLLVRRYGGITLVLGRYVLGPAQSLIPLVAGAAGMPARRFHAWNLLSGTLWVPIVLAPGYLTAKQIVRSDAAAGMLPYLFGALTLLSIGGVLVAVLTSLLRSASKG